MILDYLKLSIDSEEIHENDRTSLRRLNNMNRTKLEADVSKSKYLKDRLETNPNISDNELRNMLFWSKLQRNHLCQNYLVDWFRKNNLLVFDEDCGKSTKLKI